MRNKGNDKLFQTNRWTRGFLFYSLFASFHSSLILVDVSSLISTGVLNRFLTTPSSSVRHAKTARCWPPPACIVMSLPISNATSYSREVWLITLSVCASGPGTTSKRETFAVHSGDKPRSSFSFSFGIFGETIFASWQQFMSQTRWHQKNWSLLQACNKPIQSF